MGWRVIGWIVLALTIIAIWFHIYIGDLIFVPTGEDSEEYNYAGCNVAGIVLHGDLDTYVLSTDPETGESIDAASSEDIMYWIQRAEDESGVKAILFEIDSYGGYSVAAEEVANALKHAIKPTVVQIRGAGLSAAYWAATGGDIIFASELSDVGSIGVTQSYIDASGYNQKEGYLYNSLSTSKYKDMFDPEKPLTAEEKALAMRDIQITYEAFIRVIAENRELDISKVRALADGSSMLGKMALENGLIDKIGGFDEVEEYLKGIVEAEPVICW